MIRTPVGNAQQEQMHARERERGACFHANMTHNKAVFERDKVEATTMQNIENVPDFLKKELSGILAITVPLI